MRRSIFFAIALSISAGTWAQESNRAAQLRAEQNHAVCEAENPVVAVDHPGKVVDALREARERCYVKREADALSAMMEQCRKSSSRMARPLIPAQLFYRDCMLTSGGYIVPD